MNKKLIFFVTLSVLISLSYSSYSIAESIPGQIYEDTELLTFRNVTVYAPAVAQTESGNIGVISTITVTIQSHGSGRIFVDTLPLAQVDMQGSARLAVKVARALVENDKNCSEDPFSYDYFIVVRTSAPIIGGPSAGAVMTVATISLLEGWNMSNKTVMTGMVNPDGSIGPIGGIEQKIDAANSVGATRFLIPKGQSTPALVEYGMGNYGIQVIEVADVNEATHNFTAYYIAYEVPNGKITTEQYIIAMKPLASTLLDEAKNRYNESSNLFDMVKSKIPNYRDYYNEYYYRDDIRSVLHNAEDWLEESEEWYNQKLYYTSLTISFHSLIDSQFVIYACEYYDTDEADRGQYIEGLITETIDLYNEKSNLARNAEIKGLISLQGIGAAQKRASEAEDYIILANSSYKSYDPLACLTYLATAKERSNSVGWWQNISSRFNDTGKINVSDVDILAMEYIEDAQQSITYSNILLEEIGGQKTLQNVQYINDAESLIESAKDNREKKFPAAALFEALEALVKANLAIETIGIEDEETLLDKTDRANKSAANSISKSRNQGIEPILAVSYYEYAQSLYNQSEYDSALFYYKYSGMIAGALGFTNVTSGSASSRYIGVVEQYDQTHLVKDNDYKYYIYLAICAGLAGIGIGLILGSSSNKKIKDESKKKTASQHFKTYPDLKQHNTSDEMPRSIKDYYKKNK